MSELKLSRRNIIAGCGAMAAQLILPKKSLAQTGSPSMTPNASSVNLDHFVADCIEANKETDSQAAVSEVLQRSVYDPVAMLNAVGEPSRAGISVLHRSETLTIFNATWTPQMNLMPHDHHMWASIGIYTGREDNIFWQRENEIIEAYEAEALFAGDVGILPVDAIHSVTNPLQRFTGGIHIYGGDFFDTTRHEWNPDTMEEGPSDGESIRAMFDAENRRRGIH